VLLAALLAATLSGGWRPRRRTAAVLLAAPLASVAAAAWVGGNPFNGSVMLVASGVVLVASARTGRERIVPGPAWALGLGAAAIAFGWAYPHFLDGSPLAYLVAAPVGVLPCPTLAVVLGLALLADGLGSRATSRLLGALGAFYALFGVAVLRVWLDVGLLVPAVAIFALAQRMQASADPDGRRLFSRQA
jgi:hypothetical protein